MKKKRKKEKTKERNKKKGKTDRKNKIFKKVGPMAQRSKQSDLDRGRGDPGSNLHKGMLFFVMVN